ncbi:MAG: transposase [Elusimicrobia bacterium]|nr:transposase [Elusimicrobiota bacterium]
MGRLARFNPSNSYFHIVSRGNNRQKVFIEDEDYEFFLRIVEKCIEKFKWKVHHYVLMNNHYHLIIFNSEHGNLSDGVKYLNQSYVQYFRKKYGGCGHLWQDRFRSFVVENGIYLLECGRYIELNPIRAGLVKDAKEYKWSSYMFYAFTKSNVLVQRSPEYIGLSENIFNRQKLYIEFIKDGLREKRDIKRNFRNGYYGSKDYGDKLKFVGLTGKGWKPGQKIRNNNG